MKRLTVDDDIKPMLTEAIRVADTRERLSAKLDGGTAEPQDESSVLRLALREFISDQHGTIAELADGLSRES